ncbi:hypothetical protein JKF63_06285 [Porcisia hertigi]|uniref:Uncharacterized protein n=1 Tax=Porcisia hertigi TaxID=2761500 RepID=A0A836IPP5_9TRYP|nr:hypothetical protein JKF63_06285 [Porcisia hertigi]
MMLRRLTCTAAPVGYAAAVVSPAVPSSSPMMAQLPNATRGWSKALTYTAASPLSQCRMPGHTQRRCYTSRSGEEKSDANKGKEAPAAVAAAVSATPGTAATSAVHFFSANEKNVDAAAHAQSDAKKQEQAASAAVDGGATAPSSIRTIGIKLSEDDELVRAFNSFSKSVNGCTQEEFLAGAKQAYYSLAVVISAFVEHAQPLVGKTESTRTIAAAHEATKLLDNVFKPKGCAGAGADAAAAAAEAASQASKAKEGDKDAPPPASSKATLQDSLINCVVSTIVSLIPVSRHLAESIFKIWVMHKEKKVNLSSIASPEDYVLDSKLVIFARLGKARMYFNTHNVGAEVDVTFSNDYLRKLDPAVLAGSGVERGEDQANVVDNPNENDFDRGMIQVHTDTEANAHRTTAEEHTFVVNKATGALMPTGSTIASTAAAGASAAERAKSSNTVSRVQVTCAKVEDLAERNAGTATSAAPVEPAESTAKTEATEKVAAAAKGAGSEAAEEEEEHAVYIKVNGNMLPPIPASAHACALLTVDVVVPPERYAYNFEWFYKRIVGYENEYERIAAARVFASNSPKPLANFLDFFMRMVTGKPVEFLFSKAIGRMIGIPEDVSQTPPATRKLMCMYMDHSKKWVLADLITLAPVMETKLPKA